MQEKILNKDGLDVTADLLQLDKFMKDQIKDLTGKEVLEITYSFEKETRH